MIIKFRDYENRLRGINPDQVVDVESADKILFLATKGASEENKCPTIEGIGHTMVSLSNGQQRGVKGEVDDVINQLNGAGLESHKYAELLLRMTTELEHWGNAMGIVMPNSLSNMINEAKSLYD